MQRVKVEKNKVRLSFNDQFYDKKFIELALEDFNEVCTSKWEDHELILKPKDKLDINILGYEFYNYVLGLIKNQ